MANYIIYNMTKYDVGFRRPGDVEVTIRPGRFVNLTEIDVLYEAPCMTKWLADGVLKCEDDGVYELLGINREHAIVAYDEAEIVAKLKLPFKRFKAWFEELDSEATLRRVLEVASACDELPQNKAEIIEKATGSSISIKRKQSEIE